MAIDTHVITRRRSLLISGLLLASSLSSAAEPTLSQQLLDSYFKTAGVCTTSQVENIRDAGDIVTIEISIEAPTRKSLLAMDAQDRDNWFSLHCPPEIHGVWHQEHPPADIQVTGQIAPEQNYTLSCVEYQQNQWNQRDSTMKEKILEWLEKRLE